MKCTQCYQDIPDEDVEDNGDYWTVVCPEHGQLDITKPSTRLREEHAEYFDEAKRTAQS